MKLCDHKFIDNFWYSKKKVFNLYKVLSFLNYYISNKMHILLDIASITVWYLIYPNIIIQ